MNALDSGYNIFDTIRKIGVMIAIIAAFVMMVYITADVIARNFLPSSMNMVGTYEFTQAFIMPLVGFPAMPYAYKIGLMPRIVMLTDRLKPGARRAMAIVLPIIHVCFFIAIAAFSLRYAMQSVADKITVLCGTKELPVYPLYFLPPYAFFMIAIEDIFVLIKNLKTKGRESILYAQD